MAEVKVFRVERGGVFDWRLYACSRYGGRFVASFWTRRGAGSAAEALNLFDRDRPAVKAREDAYDEQVREIMGRVRFTE